jgi:hypothetical protein
LGGHVSRFRAQFPVPRLMAIPERLHEGERQKKEDGDVDK